MNLTASVLRILDSELNLQGKALHFDESTRLRGSLPQLDSIAIVSLITALEAQLGFEFPEDQLDGAVFESVGSLVRCVSRLLADTEEHTTMALVATSPADRLHP